MRSFPNSTNAMRDHPSLRKTTTNLNALRMLFADVEGVFMLVPDRVRWILYRVILSRPRHLTLPHLAWRDE